MFVKYTGKCYGVKIQKKKLGSKQDLSLTWVESIGQQKHCLVCGDLGSGEMVAWCWFTNLAQWIWFGVQFVTRQFSHLHLG